MPKSKQEMIRDLCREWREIDHNSHADQPDHDRHRIAIKARDILATFIMEEVDEADHDLFFRRLHAICDSMEGAVQMFGREWKEIDVAHANGKPYPVQEKPSS